MREKLLMLSLIVSFSVPLYPLTALPTIIAVEQSDSTVAIPLFKDVAVTASALAPVVVTAPLHGTTALVPANSTYWKLQRPASPAFKQIPITWLKYKPTGNFTGTDSFTYHVTDGNGVTSNTVTCIVKVRPRTPAGQTILFLVHDTLISSLSSEINRMKSDMEHEGFSVIVKSYRPASRTSAITGNNIAALAAWNSIREEYLLPGSMLTGAILFGYVPPISSYKASDDGYWNMSLPITDWHADSMCFHLGSSSGPTDVVGRNDTTITNYGADIFLRGGSLRHIWVSRFYALGTTGRASSPYGGEMTLMKRMLDNNHNYRTGLSRYPYTVYHYSKTNIAGLSLTRFIPIWQDTVKMSNAKNAGIVISPSGDTTRITPYPYSPGCGGELWDINCHGNTDLLNLNETSNGGSNYPRVTSDSLMKRPFQTRFVFLSACHTSYPGNITNAHLLTRGGGAVLSMGTSDYVHFGAWFSIANSQSMSIKLAEHLAAGSNWGNAWLSSDMPLCFTYFYGDLSLKPKMAPSNQLPVIANFTKTTANGSQTRISVDANDADGSVVSYEWWFGSHYNLGMDEPDTVTTVPFIEVANSRIVDSLVRVEIIDNYMARNYSLLADWTAPLNSEKSGSAPLLTPISIISSSPNPFNPSSRISLNLENTSAIRLDVTDLTGRRIASIANGKHRAGSHTFEWNSRDDFGKVVSSGTYIYRLVSGGKVYKVKTVLAR